MKSIKQKLEADLKYYGKILDEFERMQFPRFSYDDNEITAELRNKRDLYRKLYHVINELLGNEENHPEQ